MTTDATRPPIEVGVLVVDELREPARAALDTGFGAFEELLAERFDEFAWQLAFVERRGPRSDERVEPGELLFEGIHERDQQHWDLALVVTAADLACYQKPFTLAVPSRATGVAVLSLARIAGSRPQRDLETRARDAERLVALLMHVLGDLTGLPHSDRPEEFMFAPRELADLDRMRELPDATAERLRHELAEIADTRLEERGDTRRASRPRFYLRAAWHGLDDIAGAVGRARPWALPLRLSRLTAAALATTLVLILTAEAWDLGVRQPAFRLAAVAALSVAVAAAFVLWRQGLLLRRSRRALSEQIVVMNVSIAVVVLLGMLATWALLWVFSLVVSWSLFDRELIASWAAATPEVIGVRHGFAFASFVATAGVVIGALGASFEGKDLVRHVVFADEEV